MKMSKHKYIMYIHVGEKSAWSPGKNVGNVSRNQENVTFFSMVFNVSINSGVFSY